MAEVNYTEVRYTIRRKDGDAAWTSIADAFPEARAKEITIRWLK